MYLCMYVSIYVCMYVYIGGFVSVIRNSDSLNDNFGIIANHFSQLINNILGHCKSLLADCESLFKRIRHKTFFWFVPLF